MTTETEKKLLVVDSDAHVLETERTWDFLEPSEEKFRPILFQKVPGSGATSVFTQFAGADQDYWVIDGKISGLRFPTLGEQGMKDFEARTGRKIDTPMESRGLDDVSLRLKYMDQTGVDVEIVHNTMFISLLTERPEVETAICRSYNKWMGKIHGESNGRLKWTMVPPLLDIPESINQMREAKKNGAVGVCIRPIESRDRLLSDPSLYPIYEEAQTLGMAMAVHIANASPKVVDVLTTPYGRSAGFTIFLATAMLGCHELIMSEVPQTFPNLRWSFIEGAAQWIPWVLQETERRYKGNGLSAQWPENDPMAAFNIYVTCQSNDDVGYILKWAGDNSLLIGTDYGHLDASAETDAIELFRERTDITEDDKIRILSHNPMRCFDL